jgi:type II secretory pathway pseudopilin PulG
MNHDKTKGFTLIELTLAMSFIAVLLLAIALTIIQISAIYNRGLTLKDINQAGITITNDLQESIADSPPFVIAPPNTAPGNLYILNKSGSTITGGRLCLGQYSYIWNFGTYVALTDPSIVNVYNGSTKPINFIRISDPGSNYCLNDKTGTAYYKVDPSSALDLLDVGDHNLAIHAFSIESSSTGTDAITNQQLYSIEFSIGTNDLTALNTVITNGVGTTSCKLPSAIDADPTYCAVDIFDTVARAGDQTNTGSGQ